MSDVRRDLDLHDHFGQGNTVVSLQTFGSVYKIGWGSAL